MSADSYVLEAQGWQITAGHAEWLASADTLAWRPDIRSAYRELEYRLRPDTVFRIVGILDNGTGSTEYSPVTGGAGVRMVISERGIAVEEFQVCVADEIQFGLVDVCDCDACLVPSR